MEMVMFINGEENVALAESMCGNELYCEVSDAFSIELYLDDVIIVNGFDGSDVEDVMNHLAELGFELDNVEFMCGREDVHVEICGTPGTSDFSVNVPEYVA